MKYLTLIAMLSAFAAPAFSHDKVAGDLHIIHPSIPDPLPMAKSAAGYMAIVNDGEEPDRLIEVRTDFARASTVHQTVVDDAGVARMIPMVEMIIPPGDVLTLEPGGMHVMFMGLTRKADEGDMIPATLVFERAGEIEIEFMVDPMGGVDHSTMDHSN